MTHHVVKVYGDQHGDPEENKTQFKKCNKATECVTAIDFSKPLFCFIQIGEND